MMEYLSNETRDAAVAMARTAALLAGGDRAKALAWLASQSQTAPVLLAAARIRGRS